MDRERAIALVGYLVAATTGWNDDSVLVYTAEIEKLSNYVAAGRAVRTIASTWTEARRPPIAEVLNAYRRELSRSHSAPKEINPGRPLELSQGIAVARRGYEQERRLLGKPVRMEKFDAWIDRIGGAT